MNKSVMLPMKLTTTAFKRKSCPATSALEDALRQDEQQSRMQGKRPRLEALVCKEEPSTTPYSMSGLFREATKLEHAISFPTIEWCFDDDDANDDDSDDDDDEGSSTSMVSEQGSVSDQDTLCNTTQDCWNPSNSPRYILGRSVVLDSAPPSASSRLLVNNTPSMQVQDRLLFALGAADQLQPLSRARE
jgi:hypothetical protein